MYWIYDIPNWKFGFLTVGIFDSFGIIGLLLVRRFLNHASAHRRAHAEMISYYFAAIGALYGITLGLISVGAWQNFSDTDNKAGLEASAVTALYRDVSSFPEPDRTQLQEYLYEYVRYVVEDAWPQQSKGIIPPGGSKRLSTVQKVLYSFEPKTVGQVAIHTEALKQFNRVVELSQSRIQSVTSGLPSTVWWVVILGAAINITITWMFVADSLYLHLALTSLYASLIGLLVFLTAAMDNPYRGDFSVGPDALQAVQQGLMKGQTSGSTMNP